VIDDDEFESTVVMVRGAAKTITDWKMIDEDGTEFALHLANVLGRKPSTDEAPQDAQVISLSDPDRVLSRTHALIEVDAGELWVTDLGSTNGTGILASLDQDDDDREECPPSQRTLVPHGATLSFGGRKISFVTPPAHAA